MTNEFELLDELAAAAKEKHYPIYRIAMYMDGRLEERELIPAPECIALYSVSKNYITAGCGMAIDEGLLSYDTTVFRVVLLHQDITMTQVRQNVFWTKMDGFIPVTEDI